MAEAFERFAIYYAPESGSDLEAFGRGWFAWDPEADRAAPALEIEGLPAPRAALTKTAARYGLHATLRAPFRLAPKLSLNALTAALSDFAEDAAMAVGPRLVVSDDLGFVSLRPDGPAPAIDELAADCVRSLNAFRAPLTEAETARRRASGLSEAQEAHLAAWGYPYVLDAFRFHITLTSRLEGDASAQASAALRAHLEPMLRAPFQIREICLFGDQGAGQRFRLLRRFRLQG